MESGKPHAILFPYPLQGHINPMMGLAQLLASHGFLITFVSTHYRLASISLALTSSQPQRQSPLHHPWNHNIRFQGLPDGLPSDHDREPGSPGFLDAVDNLGNAFDELLHQLSSEQAPITCIISDSFLHWTQAVASKWAIPWVFFWTQSAAVYAIYANMGQLKLHGYDPFNEDVKAGFDREQKEPFTCIPGLPPMHPLDLPFRRRGGIDPSRKEWLARILDSQFKLRHEAVWVIGNSFDELEGQVIQALQTDVPIRVVGPLLPSALMDGTNSVDTTTGASFWKEDDCLEWLDLQAPSSILYISLGSIAKMSDAQINEIAKGLLAASQPFLWVIRAPNINDVLPTGFEEFARERGRMINWAPQTLVLSHPAVGGFLTHCGWNSTLESVSMGVPLLAWPQYLDQFTNCRFIVEEWKVGVELGAKDGVLLEGEELARALKVVMQGEESKAMKERIGRLREAAKRAVQVNEGSSARTVQLFVDDMTRRARLKFVAM